MTFEEEVKVFLSKSNCIESALVEQLVTQYNNLYRNKMLHTQLMKCG